LGYLVTNGPPGCTNEPSQSPPVFIAGDSSGGTLAYSALLAISAGRWSLPGNARVAGALLFSPWTNMRCDTPSYLHNAHASVKLPDGGEWHNGDVAYRDLPAKSVADSLENAIEYLGDRALLDDPVASPILADREMLQDMPPLLFTVASNELIMGDAVISAQNAAAAGAPVILDIYEGMWHVFPMYSEGRQAAVARAASAAPRRPLSPGGGGHGQAAVLRRGGGRVRARRAPHADPRRPAGPGPPRVCQRGRLPLHRLQGASRAASARPRARGRGRGRRGLAAEGRAALRRRRAPGRRPAAGGPSAEARRARVPGGWHPAAEGDEPSGNSRRAVSPAAR